VTWACSSATGGAVELFAEDVGVPGVPGGLARHVGHDRPQRVPVAVDRDGEERVRIADGTDRAVAVLPSRHTHRTVVSDAGGHGAGVELLLGRPQADEHRRAAGASSSRSVNHPTQARNSAR
jgi:hypothetical protein